MSLVAATNFAVASIEQTRAVASALAHVAVPIHAADGLTAWLELVFLCYPQACHLGRTGFVADVADGGVTVMCWGRLSFPMEHKVVMAQWWVRGEDQA